MRCPGASLLLVASLGLPASLLVVPAPSLASDAPDIAVLIERISLSLGGAEGGGRVLEAAKELDFVFRGTVRDGQSGTVFTAAHRYLMLDGGRRRRLDIRVESGEGKDSASVIDGERGWLVVDGARHDVEPAAIESRLPEFSPAMIFSVPLALATEGRQILGDAALSVVERVESGGGARFVLIGTGVDGRETARLEVDAKTYRPLEVSFQSPAGHVTYRYEDYREVAKGLIVPFKREFIRNGVRIGTTEVLRFGLRVPAEPGLFDPAVLELPPLADRAASKK
jgi:hypothetical protein